MKRLFLWLLKPWVLSLLGVLLLSLLLWFEGPLLAFDGNEPFASSRVRWYFITFFLIVWAGYFLWRYIAARLANRRLTASLAEPTRSGSLDPPPVLGRLAPPRGPPASPRRYPPDGYSWARMRANGR